jgi:fatty acid desaturase
MDATNVFREFHGPGAKHVLRGLPSEEIVPAPLESSAIERDFRALRDELETEGRFRPSAMFYTRKVAELFALLGSAVWLLSAGRFWTSAAVLGLFFQQSGWLSHDFAHSQVIRDPRRRRWILYLVGPVFQGFTASWWIPKHMTHHAHPNAIDEKTGRPIDTDIDTAPFIYWTARLLPSRRMNTFLVRNQGYVLWMVLPFSKFVWDYFSIVATYKKKNWVELALTAVHHVVFLFAPALWTPRWALYYVVARLWAGFFIGWVFIMSHNAMEYYDRPALAFYESQVRTTRNVTMSRFVTWFTGGLNYQIEHHLFPRMPRHHFPAVAYRVQQLCLKHDLKYTVLGMFSCSAMLTRYLNNVGQ